MRSRLFTFVLVTLSLVFVAIVLAAGARIVEWLVGDNGDAAIWKTALTLLLGAIGGAGSLSALRERNGNRDEGGSR